MEARREFLKKLLFGGVTAAATAAGVDRIVETNQAIASEFGEVVLAGKKMNTGCVALTFGTLKNSIDFPLSFGRDFPESERSSTVIAPDGTIIWFIYPSATRDGRARGYVKPVTFLPEWMGGDQRFITYRIKKGLPDGPYYLRWKSGNIYLYSHVGSLLKRAGAYWERGDETSQMLAIADLSFALTISLSFSGKGDDILPRFAELKERLWESNISVVEYRHAIDQLLEEAR